MNTKQTILRHIHDMVSNESFKQILKEILKKGNIKELTALMEERGLHVNSQLVCFDDNAYTSVLHLAVDVARDSYHAEFVDFILSQGAHCNKMDEKGFAPLHYAVLRSNTAAAQALIKAGADVNLQVCPPFPNKTWMMRSIVRIMRYSKKMKSFPLHMATTAPQSGPSFFRPFPFCTPYNNGIEPFYGPQNLDLIKLLLSSGANCNVLDGQGLAPLHYAVWADDVSAADILLESGADINIRIHHEKATPLFCVVSTKMLFFLLSKKSDRTISANYGIKLLSHFISSRKHKLALALLSDSSESDKTAPLDCAFRNNDKLALELLLKSGCDLGRERLMIHVSSLSSPEYEKLKDAVTQIAFKPRNLFDLCRFKIRNILKTNIRIAVLGLPLPEHLKGALCLEDVAHNLNLSDD